MQKWQIVSIYLVVSGVFLKSLHEESTKGKDEMCSFPGGTWQIRKARANKLTGFHQQVWLQQEL